MFSNFNSTGQNTTRLDTRIPRCSERGALPPSKHLIAKKLEHNCTWKRPSLDMSEPRHLFRVCAPRRRNSSPSSSLHFSHVHVLHHGPSLEHFKFQIEHFLHVQEQRVVDFELRIEGGERGVSAGARRGVQVRGWGYTGAPGAEGGSRARRGVHGGGGASRCGQGVAVTCRMSFPHKLSSDEGEERFRELPPAEGDNDEGISGGGLAASGAAGVAGSSGWPSGPPC